MGGERDLDVALGKLDEQHALVEREAAKARKRAEAASATQHKRLAEASNAFVARARRAGIAPIEITVNRDWHEQKRFMRQPKRVPGRSQVMTVWEIMAPEKHETSAYTSSSLRPGLWVLADGRVGIGRQPDEICTREHLLTGQYVDRLIDSFARFLGGR
jgi:hypothetical protein